MIRTAAISDVGLVRERNEDAWFIGEAGGCTLALVADGVGGRGNGAKASAAVADYFRGLLSEGKLDLLGQPTIRDALLRMAIHTLHAEISRRSVEDEDCRGMACTLTLVVASETEYSLFQVGDSRLYQWEPDALRQISTDQTLTEELVRAGRLSEDQKHTHPDRHTLTQAIGVDPMRGGLEPVVSQGAWSKGSMLLLCSDGLSGMVSDADIAASLKEETSLESMAAELRDAALAGGGKDNITIVLLHNEGND